MVRQCWILLQGVHMVNTREHRSPRKWRIYLATTNFGAQENSDTGINTFTFQATNNQSAYAIWEEIEQIRTKLGMALEHVMEGK